MSKQVTTDAPKLFIGLDIHKKNGDFISPLINFQEMVTHFLQWRRII